MRGVTVVLAALLLLACGPTPWSYWHEAGPPARYQLEFVVDPAVVATRCDPQVHPLGCTFWPDPETAVSYIRGRLPAGLRECVGEHEHQHRLGRAHGDVKLSYVDCGDGTWVTPALN